MQPKASTYVSTNDEYVIIGAFSGSLKDELQLRTVMSNYNVVVQLEGSVVYDLYVPASKAGVARDVLRTNELTSQRKVFLLHEILPPPVSR